MSKHQNTSGVAALQHLFHVVQRLDQQADGSGHMVQISAEAWKDLVRPAIRAVEQEMARSEPGIKTVTVRGRDVGEAIIEAGLYLADKDLQMTGQPTKTNSYAPSLSTGRTKVWLWKVPVGPRVQP